MSIFRGRPCCPCQAEWLPVFEAEAQRRGFLTGQLPISQLIGGAKQSGNTHIGGGAADLYPLDRVLDIDGLVWLARQMGAPATWLRPKNWDGKNGVKHVHSVLAECPHNGTARYQIDAVHAGYNGLGKGGLGGIDDGDRPVPDRTWREGIAWAKAEQAAAAKAARIALRRAKLRKLLARIRATPAGPVRRQRRRLARRWRRRIRRAER